MSLDGSVIGHSLTVSPTTHALEIKPSVKDVVASERGRLSIMILHNNMKLNIHQGEVGSAQNPAVWESAPLMKGLNIFKIAITANATRATGGAPEYRTQVYVLCVNRGW